jgi:hypothetical protein
VQEKRGESIKNLPPPARAARPTTPHRRASLHQRSSRSLGFMHKKLLLAEENKFRVVRAQFYYAW